MVEEGRINCKKMTGPLFIFLNEASSVFKLDELGIEIAKIAFPAALALTADPIASLIDTAFIGQIGSVELAAVGVSIALFNQVSRIAIFPLVSITTSFVAEEDTITQMAEDSQDSEKSFELESPVESETKRLISKDQNDSEGDSYSQESFGDSFEGNQNRNEKKRIPSASSALIIGLVLGILQAVLLIAAAQPLLKFMGVKEDSGMLKPAEDYLTLRSLGAPAVLLSLAMQGVFRGMKDTTTPLYATVVGDTTNIILDPIFIFLFHLGVRGAAIAHVISQYVMAALLFWRLVEQVHLVPPSAKYLQFGRFLRNGFMLLMRVIAVTFCVTLAASLAARLGATQMAAFQVCLQIWLATSLLADGLAVAGQAILASSFAKEDYSSIISTSSRVLQLGVVLGVVLTILLGLTLRFGAKLFTNDPVVLHFIGIGIPFVAATQPINSLAFVFDGVNFGASDFAYAAYSMVVVAIFSIFCLLVLSSGFGFVGIWVALTIYMSLRALAGFGRIGTGTGPWKFLRS